MGTGFDCFDPTSRTQSAAISSGQRKSRDLLVRAMAARGFRNYAAEWWHFTFQHDGSPRTFDFAIRDRGAN